MTSRPKNIVLLGSTGSIGRQTLDVIERLPGQFRVIGLAAARNAEQLLAQARHCGAPHVALLDETRCPWLRDRLPYGVTVYGGMEGLQALAGLPDADIVVVAIAGAAGIKPTEVAVRAGRRIALASKEVLVATGSSIMRQANQSGAEIIPVDSEHSAIFQCLQGHSVGDVDRLILTASGGPLRQATLQTMRTVTPADVLRHPTWNMGNLVTVNSATLMNKGLEIIEAHWLFGVPEDRIDVLIHPQSIVHSLVRFADGSTLAQLGVPDMRLPIQYALTYPAHVSSGLPAVDLAATGTLTFEPPDEERFPALRMAREALRVGGTMPAVMNAANEVAVELFLKQELDFLGIMELVRDVMSAHSPMEPSPEAVIEADTWARQQARQRASERSLSN